MGEMCVLFLPPCHIYREELQGLHTVNAVAEALGTDLGKLPGAREGWRSVVGPTSRPTTMVGRPVGPTTGHCLWPRSFLVGPLSLATCLSFCHVITRVAL